MPDRNKVFAHLPSDFSAGLVVFLVALPLCLGIALSSGAPLFSGIIAGIVGGIVVGILSGSQTSVSGPAAGLTVIVLAAIKDLGSFEAFLLAVILAGIIQILLGVIRAGIIGYYFPTSVIKGMLAGIGVILIIKQLPYAFGVVDAKNLAQYIPFVNDWESVMNLRNLVKEFHFGSLIITSVALGILILWDVRPIKEHKVLKYIPGPLLAVLLGVGVNKLFKFVVPGLYIDTKGKVVLPSIESVTNLVGEFHFPDFSAIGNSATWVAAFTIAIIASLETLLSLEAADKIDKYKRVSNPNRELLAQGTGNIINGLIGGIPITSVIVRSSANVTSGSRTRMSAIIHGFLLLGSVLLIPDLLNLIPLAALAAILLLIGYKLARISLFKQQARLGMDQFLPFFITILGILVFDLLVGIALGMVVGFGFILMRNYQNSHFFKETEDKENTIHITLAEEVSFLNKGTLIKTLESIPNGKKVIIDGRNSKVIDYDVLEVIQNFKISSSNKDIEVSTIDIPEVDVSGEH
jgi:MFS superfamily sulfate permease-like transporter